MAAVQGKEYTREGEEAREGARKMAGGETTVLVTGCSGYVGSYVVDALLRSGFKVRGSVRRRGNAAELAAAVGATKAAELEECVCDLMQDGGWDTACEGARYVCHVASPFPIAQQGERSASRLLSSFYRVSRDEYENIIKPAIEGTRRVLSAAACSTTVERVVVTSSVASVCGGLALRSADGFDEKDWTPLGDEDGSAKVDAYCRSKSLAEKIAWLFAKKAPITRDEILASLLPPSSLAPSTGLAPASATDSFGDKSGEEEQDEVATWMRAQVDAIDALFSSGARRLEIATVNPSYVMGPMMLKRHCDDSTSSVVVKKMLTMQMRAAPALSLTCVDVRDVAEAHLGAMLDETASGERYIANAGSAWLLDIGGALREKYGARFALPRFTAPYFAVYLVSFFDREVAAMLPNMGHEQRISGDKTKAALLSKREYIPISESVVELAEALIKHGIVA